MWRFAAWTTQWDIIHTQQAVTVETSRGSIQLTLRRDSGNAHEYWVFYRQFHLADIDMNDVGHVFTNALDSDVQLQGDVVTPKPNPLAMAR